MIDKIFVATRYKIKPRTALSAQYIPTLNGENTSYNLAIGIDIETGGHVFQMFVTTSRALNDQYLVAGENGNFFGEIALLENSPRSASAYALTNTELLAVFRSDLDRLISKEPFIAAKIMKQLAVVIGVR